ncbi:MAG: bifunctional adenosylcobinamide kinase/adenosylcobinamide-phosphate guanylyltransferase [Betaproteobacteria bacterium]|nr:bifunctional adenosylcobinamide kinase/adenosylcobinamide-phosphate guanylyltransferase [Betaproteobacteria bacterium]
MSLTLIVGGARSGKSAYAQRLAQETRLPVTVIATAQARDGEMLERIARHRAERPADWRTVEEPLRLAEALAREAGAGKCLVVDCLTLWLNNRLDESHVRYYPEARRQLLDVLPMLPGEIILVANEVGLGVVPLGELSRRFVDEAGWLNQAIGQAADDVVFVAAGLPLKLKATPRHDDDSNY